MLFEKVLGYVFATLAALAAIMVPITVALINRRKPGEDTNPVMGLPISVDHSNDAYDMLKTQLAECRAQGQVLTAQIIEAHTGWRSTNSRLDAANAALRAAGLPTL